MQAGLVLASSTARATAAGNDVTDVEVDPRQSDKARSIKDFLETPEAKDLCSALASLLYNSGDAESRKDVAQDLLTQTRKLLHQRQTSLDETMDADRSLAPAAAQRSYMEGGYEDDRVSSKGSRMAYKEARSVRGRMRRFCRYIGDMPGFTAPSVGCLRKRVFACFEDQSPSKLSKLILILLVLTILVSTVSFLMESMPQYRHRPSRCKELQDLGLPLTVEECEPKPDANFYSIEAVCISIFTVDYFIRVVLSHAGFETSRYKSALGRTCDYLRQPMNVVDFLAILPFYVDIAVGDSKLSFIAVLRLARILRIFKLAKHHPGVKIFWEVLVMSGQPLFVLTFLNVIIALVFGTLIYNVEGQQYSVAPKWTAAGNDHPDGVYVRNIMRWGSSGDFGNYERIVDEEITPFQSIPRALWWVLVTLTTVGYGDYAPKTYLGKTVGVLAFYTGILFLALPISVLGSNMEIVYNKHYAKEVAEKERQREREQQRRLSQEGCMSRGSSWTVVPFLPAGSEKNMGLRKTIFFLFDSPQMSRLGKVIALWMLAVIMIVTATFVLESMPALNTVPDECQNEKTVENCEPQPPEIFHYIEVVGISIFTIDYLLRICTVHVCRPFECGLEVDPDDVGMPGWKVTYLYACQLMNIIDLLAILPFYLQIVGIAGTGATSVLRILRLVRVFRVLRMPQLSSCVAMFGQIITDSLPALFLLNFMTLLACVLISSCIVFAEGQHYSVDRDKLDPISGAAEGAYIRPHVSGYGWEVSPFTDIPYAFWWFFATATTVGYGDVYPTTTFGRCLGLVTFYVGIILLALPITIIGGYFSKHYSVWLEELQAMTWLQDQASAESQLAIAAEGNRAPVFENPDLGSPKGQRDEMRLGRESKDTSEHESQPSSPGRADAAALPGEVGSKS